jgi:hypothetical protein
MHGTIADTECLAIFVYDSNKVKRDGIHWRAFLPSQGERSLFRIDGLSALEVAEIGKREAATNRQQELKGWARLIAREVTTRPPLLLKADEPPPRHAVITNWPTDTDKQRELAAELAGAQAPHVRWPG